MQNGFMISNSLNLHVTRYLFYIHVLIFFIRFFVFGAQSILSLKSR